MSQFLSVLEGNNAQGKTNLLEAIYFLATGRSFRTGKDSDLINWESCTANVKGMVHSRFTSTSAEISLSRGAPKNIRLGGNIQRKLSDYIGTIPVVTFCPDDLELVKGAPQIRRRFLDMLLAQSHPHYCRNISLYSKILQQRNALLKRFRERARTSDELEPWTQQLIDVGSRIMSARYEALPILQGLARDILSSLTVGQEKLELKYTPSFELQEHSNIELEMREEFANKRVEEVHRGNTLVGPHRDDIAIKTNGFDLKLYGSQGQQRSAVLSLKIAEVAYIEKVKGEKPILLLDDVMSELDHHRQSSLISGMVGSTQTIVTTTDLSTLRELRTHTGETIVYTVCNGFLREER